MASSILDVLKQILAKIGGGASTPTIYNVSAVSAGTEYSQALNTDTNKFIIRVRGRANLQLAFTVTESATNYITIPAGSSFTADSLSFGGTLYFQTDKASQIVEILEWT